MEIADLTQRAFLTELTDNEIIIRDTIRDFAEKNIRPYIMEYDELQKFPSEIIKQLGELGFLGVLIPEEFGGVGLGYREFSIVIEELARVDPSVALSVAAHNGLCTNHIYLFGNEYQRKKYLPDLTSGTKLGAWGLTESSSGSDAAGMKSYAEKKGDHYILNGGKTFITHGTVGSIAVVMAITDKSKGKKGISAFILEKGMEGFIAGKKENKLGMRASDTTQLIFENCRISVENLLGNEGEGYDQAMNVLEGGRISIAALSVGLAQGCLDASIKYGNERMQFNKRINQFQAIQFKLADIAVNIEAARMLTHRAAYLKDNGKPVRKEAAEAKLFASEIAEKASSEAVHIHGGYGFIKDFPVEKFYRDVKLCTIGEGTSEIQRIVIAKEILNSSSTDY
ncbi:MAG TPA: acyl-CoA dehydrogenase family protein [Ignavibacteriaceae bacterium]|nr:acyl-CoA dehydrogenase family protein [Ignavibacteriaceae bacterium]